MCREAVRRDPYDYRSLVLLSHVVRERGDFADSAGWAEKAIRLRPNMVEAYFQLGLNMLELGRVAQAVSAFKKAVELRPAVAVFHLNLGLALERMGNREQAKRCFLEAARRDPANLQARLCLAAQLLSDEQLAAARTHVEAALRIAPRSAAAHLVMAEVLLSEDAREAADESIRKALVLDPSNSSAHAMYGFRRSQAGMFGEAERHFRRSIELDPAQGLAYLGLSQGRKFTDADREFVAQMEAVKRDRPMAPDEAGSLHFALAKACDDLGEYGKAMATYDEAHRLAFSFRYGLRPFDFEEYGRSIQLIEDLYADPLPPRGGSKALSGNVPIFIVGMIRSGTTLTEQILSSHPDVGAAGEHPFWQRNAGRSDLVRSLAGDAEQAAALADEYVKELRRVSPEKPRITDKLPGNYLRLGLLYSALPNAKFIHCRRDPVDTAISIYVTPNRTGSAFSHSKEGIVFAYRKYLELMEHWRRILPPGTLFEVQYEELVENPRKVMREMLEFCGLEWNESCVNPELNSKEVRTPSLWQVRQPIYRTSVARWRRYEPWLGAFRELLDSPF